jgi:inner membrane protein
MTDPAYVGLAPVRHYIGGLLFRNLAAKAYEKATGVKTDAVSSPLAIAAISLLPDADVALGIEHRGPTHSLAFAAAAGLAAGGTAAAMKRNAIAYAALTAAAVASHVAVDLLVEGGTPLNPLWPAGQDIHVHDRDYPGYAWTALGAAYMWCYYGWGAKLKTLGQKVRSWFVKPQDTPPAA